MLRIPLPRRSFIFLILFYALLAASLLAPLASNILIPNIADIFNHLAGITQAKLALLEGQFPLRVAPTEQGGLRYPLFQFYSPTSYLIAGFIYQWLTPHNPFIAYKLTIWCALVIGGLYMNRLAYWFIPSLPAAFLASVVYLTAPYYLLIIDHMGGFNETIALGILPAVLFYTLQRYEHPNQNKTLIITSLAWYLLITVHLITFIYTAIFALIFLSLLTLKNKNFHAYLRTLISMAFGCLLATWFLAPSILFSKYLMVHVTFADLNFFYTHSPSLPSLLAPYSNFTWGLSAMVSQIHPALGWAILFGVALAVYAWVNSENTDHANANSLLPILFVLFAVAFLFCWSPINFWRWLPAPLLVGQYSWRLLSQLLWIGSLIFAWSVCWLFKNNLDTRHVVLGTILIVFSSSSWLAVNERMPAKINEFIKQPFLIFNPDSYMLNVGSNPQFVDAIDNLQLTPLISNQNLKLNTDYVITPELLNLAVNPKLIIAGKVKENQQQTLIAMLDDHVAAQKPLIPGNFTWEIPLPASKNKLNLKFRTSTATTSDALQNLTLENIALTGFWEPEELMSLSQTQRFCKQNKEMTLCQIDVPDDVRLIELPIFYYPKLLKVTLNDQPIAYQSILNKATALVAIKPIPGTLNEIKIQFRGLVWANFVSWVAWILWGICTVLLFF